MTAQYQHLGVFSDWVAAAHTHNHIHPNATPGAETRHLIREVLGFFRYAGHTTEHPL